MSHDAYLVYVGHGASLPGVPARDLTKAEVDVYGEAQLLKSRLYEKPVPPQKPAPKFNKIESGGSDNKFEKE